MWITSLVCCVIITSIPFIAYSYFRVSVFFSIIILARIATIFLLFVWNFYIKKFSDKLNWYCSIIDSIPYPISVTDNNMKWTFFNRAVADLFKVNTNFFYNVEVQKIGHVEVVNEITERMLKIESIKSIGLLAAVIARGFNNMIGGIISSVELLKKHLHKNPEATKLSDIIIDPSEKAVLLINRLLLFSSNKETKLCNTYLHTIINVCVLILSGSIDKNIAIITDLQSSYHSSQPKKRKRYRPWIGYGIQHS